MKQRKPYPFVHTIKDRFGRTHHYFRKSGHKSFVLPGPVGSRQFLEAYQAVLADTPITIGRAGAGTVRALVKLYYASPEWLSLSPHSQRTYRNILEHFVAEHGDKRIAHLERKHVKAMVSAKAETPAAANKFRKLLSVLMGVAIEAGWRKDNPVTTVKGVKSKSSGFRTWNDDEIATFEARHPVGTKARLALALLLWTGQRRGDVVRLGRQHLRDGIITMRQQKTGMGVSIPILPPLNECLATAPREHLTFLVTGFGQPFTPAGFTNWFRDRCAEACLPVGLSPHGLRKAFCRRAAEAGLTPHHMMSISGHQSLSEVTRYTEAANRERLAKEAMRTIMKFQSGKPPSKFSSRPGKPLKK